MFDHNTNSNEYKLVMHDTEFYKPNEQHRPRYRATNNLNDILLIDYFQTNG